MTSTTTNIPHDHQLQQERAPIAMMKPQAKKQARRRTHASRPYQERLLNMAEARREIMTALKIHRASMRHQQQPCTPPSYQHDADTLQLLRQPPPPLQQQQVKVAFQDDQSQQASVPPAPTSYASFADHQLRNPLAHSVAAAPPAGSCYSPPPVLPCHLTQHEAPMPTTAMGGYGLGCHGLVEQLARGLPAQPLGLNLSFQGFGGSVDGAKDCEDLYGVPVVQSSASPAAAASSYSAYSPPGPATEMASGGAHGSPALSSTAEKYSSSSPADSPAAAALVAPPVLDDAEREAQSAGETPQGVECWGEAATAADDVAAASAWWSKILLESVESGGGKVAEGGAVGCAAEDGVVVAAAGFPAEWQWWLCDDGVGEQGAVTGADDPDVLETKLADGKCDYTSCYHEGGRRLAVHGR